MYICNMLQIREDPLHKKLLFLTAGEHTFHMKKYKYRYIDKLLFFNLNEK